MKKLLCVFLVMVLVLSLGTVAFAAEGDTTIPTDMTNITVTKVYKATNAGTVSPAETFTLQQIEGTVTDGEAETAPDLGTITGASFDEGAATTEGATGEITITLPSYDTVGVYEYTLQEVVGTTAGVTYYGDPIKLVVTVINGDNGKLRVAAVHTEGENAEKSDKFENTYSAGDLLITKTVTGNLGDKDKYFAFTVTLTGEEGKAYGDTYAVSGGSYESNPEAIVINAEAATFMLKHDETLTIANLPYGVTYSVVETEEEGYTTTSEYEEGAIEAAKRTAAFTNEKTGEVDTGIVLDSLPYVLLLVLAAAGLGLFLMKRRAAREN